ncbi:MAG: Uma2 family endonuclease [bacterium]
MPAIRRRWTPEDVRQLNVDTPSWPRYELIGGELLVTPSPGSPHQLAVGELHLVIAPYVDAEGLGLTFFAPSDVELREGTITQPDLYVLAAGPAAHQKGLITLNALALLLVVEVISPSSVRTDRIIKREFYMESGVAEYWVVDLDARMIERWTPERDTPVVERALLAWQPAGASRALNVELPALFNQIRQKSAWAAELGPDRP